MSDHRYTNRQASLQSSAMSTQVTDLVPMAHVADVQRSIDFYALFGLEVKSKLVLSNGTLAWAWLAHELAELMLTRAAGPLAIGQGVMFYLYAVNLVALREHLLTKGIEVSAITYPPYMPQGEMQTQDPDGYCLLIGQRG